MRAKLGEELYRRQGKRGAWVRTRIYWRAHPNLPATSPSSLFYPVGQGKDSLYGREGAALVKGLYRRQGKESALVKPRI